MWRLSRSVLFSAMLLLVSADDGWRRLEVESRAPSWARSSNTGGNRVPFAPEDIALPPPWLLPNNQQPQIAFPAAQAQVRSFFDEEPIEWPPRVTNKPATATAKSIQPQPQSQPVVQQQPQIIHTSLQPPRIGSASTIQPVQHIWYEGDRRPPAVPQRSQLNQQLQAPVRSRQPPVHPDAKKLPAERNDPYRTAVESPAGRHQQPKQATANRKSVTGAYDSSEYDYEEDGTIISSGNQEKRPVSPQNGREEVELGDQGFYGHHAAAVEAVVSVGSAADDFYDSPAAKTTTGQRRTQQRRPQVNSAEQSELDEHQSFDASKTIFRTQVNGGQNFRQQQHPRPSEHDEISRQRESGRPHGDDPATKQQPAGGRRQQQQQRPVERNPSPPELAAFEAERPSFHPAHNRQSGPQHRQQPPWNNPDANRKSNKNRNPPQRPEESAENLGTSAGRNKAKIPHRHQEENQRDQQPRPPYHNPPAPYRPLEEEPNYERPEHHQPTYELPEEQQKVKQRPRRPETRPSPQEFEQPPRHPPAFQPEENSFDPYEDQRPQEEESNRPEEHRQEEEEEQHQVEEEQPRPAHGNRRPPSGRPSFHSAEQFGGADTNAGNGHSDGDLNQPGHFNGPPQRPHHPQGNRQRPPPPHHRPRDSVVTQGLNTLKSLVGLQTSPQRPRAPHPQFNHDGRRPEGHRPDGHRQDGQQRRPPGRRPHHPQDPSFNNGGELGRLDHLEDTDEFDPSNFEDFGIQGRQNVQLEEEEEEPIEHRSDPDEEDLSPAATASTESTSRTTARPTTSTTTTAPPASSTAAPEEPKSTLFPPFSKRVRPQPPSPAQTESKNSSGKDGSSSGQLRITSYKQRIEAMKERAKQREQQQAQSKKDSDPTLELSDLPVPAASSTTSSTSTTTQRPSTTRPKVPPRMPVRKPLTSASSTSTSTTESVPSSLLEKEEKPDDSNFEQYKRRFKPKSTFSRRPVKEDEANAEEEEPSAKKNLFGKLPGISPFGRKRQQQQEEQQRMLAEEDAKPAVKAEETPAPVRINKETHKRIRPGYGRTSTTAAPPTESSVEEDQESGSVLAPPWSATSEPQQVPAKAEEEEELPRIELVSVSSGGVSDEHVKAESIEEANDFPVQHLPFPVKTEQSAEHLGVDMDADSHQQQEKPRQSFFTMATNDPILPIEELLNIRVRDNGKGM